MTSKFKGLEVLFDVSGTGGTVDDVARRTSDLIAAGELPGAAGADGVLAVEHGGTGSAAAGGTALDNISGFTTIGFLYRNSAGSYIIVKAPIIQGVGGTGLQVVAEHALLVGGAQNAMTVLALGAAGNVLVSGGDAADPAFRQLTIADVQGLAGGTVSRPVAPAIGQPYFDTTLGKPVWWSGAGWKDAAGTAA
jgi:hypothetical protein